MRDPQTDGAANAPDSPIALRALTDLRAPNDVRQRTDHAPAVRGAVPARPLPVRAYLVRFAWPIREHRPPRWLRVESDAPNGDLLRRDIQLAVGIDTPELARTGSVTGCVALPGLVCNLSAIHAWNAAYGQTHLVTGHPRCPSLP